MIDVATATPDAVARRIAATPPAHPWFGGEHGTAQAMRALATAAGLPKSAVDAVAYGRRGRSGNAGREDDH